MKRLKAFIGASIPLALGVDFLGASSQSASAGCQLNSPGGQIKRVVNIVFDNVHLRRDNPNVPSDLEQIPNLLNFLRDDRTLLPTILGLVGLTDDYAHDGRVITEAIEEDSLPKSLRQNAGTLSLLGQAYKQINAPRGARGARTLTGISTTALKSNAAGDATYTALEARIADITARRNAIAGSMIDMLEAAEFKNQPIDEGKAVLLIGEADALLASVP